MLKIKYMVSDHALLQQKYSGNVVASITLVKYTFLVLGMIVNCIRANSVLFSCMKTRARAVIASE